ncbi:inversin-B-like [Haliotis rubra]|uniref:inversin-B-like n=1 Tax=Haliotis rubra TaxID=36100 RepID=UPI001EE543BA|nr:inversin-B-like [Haliotis rubra]
MENPGRLEETTDSAPSPPPSSEGEGHINVDHVPPPPREASSDSDLHVACKRGKLQQVQHLVSSAQTDVNAEGRVGRTPVMLAARCGHDEVFHFLVTNGSDVTRLSNDDDNILHFACLGGNIEIVKYILSQNFIDIDSRGKFGRTPVMKAAWGGHVSLFDLLERVGADLSLLSEQGDTILHLACHRDNVPMVKHILSKHIVGVNCRGMNGRTPVMIAAMYGHRAC